MDNKLNFDIPIFREECAGKKLYALVLWRAEDDPTESVALHTDGDVIGDGFASLSAVFAQFLSDASLTADDYDAGREDPIHNFAIFSVYGKGWMYSLNFVEMK